MSTLDMKKPRSVLTHRRGLIPTRKEGTRIVSQPTALLNPPEHPDDEFGGIVAQFQDDNAWSATVDLALEPLRDEEIKQRDAYLKAVPGTTPWGANVTVHVVGNVIYVGRNDNPHDGWGMDADENDAVISVLFEAGRRARSNTPVPPDAA